MSKSQDNLKAAFAGESQANRKYLAYAFRAMEQELPGVAKLFRAAAEAETIHAHNHMKALKMVGDTRENLKDAVAGETHEFKEMYPEMISTAKEEGDRAAEVTFTYANEVEKVHAGLYQKALEDPENFPEDDFYVCKICGYTVQKEAPERCPVCGAKQKNFFRVD
jgi:rubrerythrin